MLDKIINNVWGAGSPDDVRQWSSTVAGTVPGWKVLKAAHRDSKGYMTMCCAEAYWIKIPRFKEKGERLEKRERKTKQCSVCFPVVCHLSKANKIPEKFIIAVYLDRRNPHLDAH